MVMQQMAIKPAVKWNGKVIIIEVDLFCGAGGTTSGFHRARTKEGDQVIDVAYCINHDINAIRSHHANFPNARHLTEDIRTAALEPIVQYIEERRAYWEALGYKVYVGVWASLECTNFSKAKGGLSRDADSRTLAEHLYRYVEALNPDFVDIENVVEFMDWGPLKIFVKPAKDGDGECCPLELIKEEKNGKKTKKIIGFAPKMVPVKERKKEFYNAWKKKMCDYGYYFEHKVMVCADHGVPTIRKRYFGCFAKVGLPINWPETTHSKKPEEGKKPWVPVKTCLHFDVEGITIFTGPDRPIPLATKSMKRIYNGCVRHIAGGKKAFLAKYHSTGHNTVSIDDPGSTIPCKDSLSLIAPQFFVDKQFNGDNDNSLSVDDTAGSILKNDKHYLTKVEYFIMNNYTSGGTDDSINVPGKSVTSVPKANLIKVDKSWLMNHSYENPGKSVDEPSEAILASRRHHYLLNPAWGGNTGDIEEPCCVVVARQDKAPLYLIAMDRGPVVIPVYEGDCEWTIKIKEFMVLYGIKDIYMRMLLIPELLKIQGFDENYILLGTQTERKKYIGNAVPPRMSQVLMEAKHAGLIEYAAKNLN